MATTVVISFSETHDLITSSDAAVCEQIVPAGNLRHHCRGVDRLDARDDLLGLDGKNNGYAVVVRPNYWLRLLSEVPCFRLFVLGPTHDPRPGHCEIVSQWIIRVYFPKERRNRNRSRPSWLGVADPPSIASGSMHVSV